jgi:hypothetical protein
MNEAEYIVLAFLQTSPEIYFARREIARRAVKRKVYDEDPHWADAALVALVDRALVEQDETGRYRLKKEDLLGRDKDEAK